MKAVEAALEYASEGRAVLPTDREKRPLVRHGVYDASLNPDLIVEWYERYPDAGVAIATGAASGLIALDLDTPEARRELLRRETPDTLTILTGRGVQLYYTAPDEPVRSFNPWPGAEIVSEGRYVVAPPSLHPNGSIYEPVVEGAPLSPLPEWLLVLADERDQHHASDGEPVNDSVEGPVIPEGSRNRTLFKIACGLRGRGADSASIRAHLQDVNRLRCSPSLHDSELRRIAASAATYVPGTAAPHVAPEVHQRLDAYAGAVHDHGWSGKGGYTDRDTLLTLISYARRYGAMIAAGVRVEVSHRDLALAAGVRRATVSAAVSRLRRAGWLRSDNRDRRRDQAGAFVLLSGRAQAYHPTTVLGGGESGTDVRASAARWSGLGKKATAVLDALDRLGGAATIRELADAIGDPRPRDLRRRQLTKLEQAGTVALDGDAVMLAGGWRDALHAERELRGELASDLADRRRYEMERRAFHGGESAM